MFTLISFLLGMKHATEADHLAAMSLLLQPNPHPVRALRMGAMWGLGHGVMLLLGGLIWLSIGKEQAEPPAINLEPVVGLVLIFMALNWAFKTFRQRKGLVVGACAQGISSKRRSYMHAFSIGLLHGLAGSMVATLLILSGSESWLPLLAQLGLFGLGGAVAMAVLCWCYSINMHKCRRIGQRIFVLIQGLCIICTMIIGINLTLV